MNYIKLFLCSFVKNKMTFIVIIVETAALFLSINYLVSTLNDIEMLNIAYKNIFSGNSVLVYDKNYMHNRLVEGLDIEQSRQKILDNINDNYKIYDVMVYQAPEITIISVSDDIYSHLALPLASGNYNQSVGSFNMKENTYTVEIQDKNLTLNLSGKLTLSTYLPIVSYISTDMTTKDMYQISPYTVNTVITNRTAIEGYEDFFSSSGTFIMQFDNNFEKNVEILNSVANTVRGSKILENTSEDLKKDFMSYMPLIICVLLVTLIGTISISMILFLQNERRNGCLWICGYSRFQILFSHVTNMVILTLIAAAIGTGIFALWANFEDSPIAGMSIGCWNIIISLLICILLGGTSIILPAIKSIKKSPVEYLRRAQ